RPATATSDPAVAVVPAQSVSLAAAAGASDQWSAAVAASRFRYPEDRAGERAVPGDGAAAGDARPAWQCRVARPSLARAAGRCLPAAGGLGGGCRSAAGPARHRRQYHPAAPACIAATATPEHLLPRPPAAGETAAAAVADTGRHACGGATTQLLSPAIGATCRRPAAPTRPGRTGPRRRDRTAAQGLVDR